MVQVQHGEVFYINSKLINMWIKSSDAEFGGVSLLGTSSNPIYLIKNIDGYILIEAGISLNSKLVLDQLIKHTNNDLSLIKYWFITHSHYDHCGSIEYLYAHLKNVKLFASEEAINNFRKEKYVSKIRQLNNMVSLESGYNGTSNLLETPFIPVKNGQKINFGSGTLEIFATPGHSECSISLFYSSNEGSVFFVSDAIGEIVQIDKWFPLAFESINKYLESVQRIKDLNPDIIALGHNGILTDFEAKQAFKNIQVEFNNLVFFILDEQHRFKDADLIQEIANKYHGIDRSYIPEKVYLKSLELFVENLRSESYI